MTGNDSKVRGITAEIHQKMLELEAQGAPLKSGGGGGTFDGMEKRVTELESNMTKAAFELAYIRGKIEDMPTKDWVSSKLSSHTAIILAVMAIGFTVIGFLATK